MIRLTFEHFADSVTYIDGPNMDGVLGAVLKHQPLPHERPCWLQFFSQMKSDWKMGSIEFVLTASNDIESSKNLFCRFLKATGYLVRTPTRAEPDNRDPVDCYILEQLSTIRSGRVVLLSHDHCYADAISGLLDRGVHVTVVGFPELMSSRLRSLAAKGLEMIDLEMDFDVFKQHLGRPVHRLWRYGAF